MLGLMVAGCSSPALHQVALAEFEGTGTGRDEWPFDCSGAGRVEVDSTSPEGWLHVELTDPTGQEAFSQVFDGGPDAGRKDGLFDFDGEGGPGWILAVERFGYGGDDRFEGSYVVRVLC
ncbi:MAG TPA: hypothetical protein VM327_07720 [Candidatus Thermoplasmatota archaeon]|nr:hypothetical protein [Candidatus Thermoplasmatota archaeon]